MMSTIAGTDFELVDVDDAWPRIAKRALKRCGSAPAVVESARARCHCGDAVCLQSADGVVIMSARGRERGGIVAEILLAVSTGLPGAFKRQEAAMLRIARDLGAGVLSFETDRRGWARLLGPAWHADEDGFSRLT